MDAYVYAADLYCEPCALDIRNKLTGEKADTGDSSDFPQGPYADGGGESDLPQHCGSGAECLDAIHIEASGLKVGAFLENPLTSDGFTWLQAELSKPNESAHSREVCALWRDHYGLDRADSWPILTCKAPDLDETIAARMRGVHGLYEAASKIRIHVGNRESDLGRLVDAFATSGRMFGQHEACGANQLFTAAALACFVRLCLADRGGIVEVDGGCILDSAPQSGDRWCDVAEEIARGILIEDLRIEVAP